MKYGKGHKAEKGKFPMLEEHSEIEDMDYAVKETTKADFGKEEHGIPGHDFPKKFVVDGGLKYDFGGPETHGVEHDIADIDERAEVDGAEDAPGRTHDYDKSAGKLKSWPKKFKTEGDTDEFDGGE